MKIKMAQAVQYIQALQNMPSATGKVGYSIYRNISLLESATKEYYQMQNDLIGKYGTDGKITQNDPNFPKFMEEITPLLNIDCDVNFFQIDEDELYNDALSTQDYLVLREIAVKPKE